TWTGKQTFSATGNGLVVTTNADFQGSIVNTSSNNSGRVYVNDGFQVTGNSWFDGNMTIGDASSDLLTINSTVNSDILVGTGTFDHNSVNPDVYVTGNLEVDGIIYGNLQNSVTAGTGLTGGSFNNSGSVAFAVDQTYNFAWTGNQTWAGTSTFNNAVNVGGTNDVRIGTGTFDNPSAAADLYVTGNIEADGTIYGTLGTALPGVLSNGAGIAAFSYDGLTDQTVAIDYTAAGTWTGKQTFSATGNGLVVTTNADFQGSIVNTSSNNSGRVYVNDGFQVTGNSWFDGNMTIGDASSDLLTINSTVNSDILVGTGTFDHNSVNPDVYVTGNLEVDGIIYGNLQNSVTAGTGLTGGSFNNSGSVAFAVDQTYNFAWTGNQTWAGTSTFNNAVNVGGTNDVRIGTGTFNNPSAAADLYVTGNIEADGTIYGTLGTALPGVLSNGAGIAAFSYDGLTDQTVAIDYTAAGTWTGKQTFSATGNGLVVTTNADFQGNIANSTGNLKLNDNVDVTGNVVPSADNTYDLGSSANNWRNGYFAGNLDVEGYIYNDAGINVLVNDNLLPNTTNTYDLGSNSFRWSTIYGQNLNLTGNINATGLATIGTVNVGGNLSVGGNSNLQGNVYNSGGDVTINDNLTIPDGAGRVKLSYGSYTVPGTNNLSITTSTVSVVTISSNNDGFADNVSLTAGTDGQILYVYFIGTDQINIAGESLISSINGRIGITLVYANGGWQIVGNYIY
ncbi:MAG: beta strand repeat-containing protein, partial [Candidatus Kapaibacteriota bacterium]